MYNFCWKQGTTLEQFHVEATIKQQQKYSVKVVEVDYLHINC